MAKILSPREYNIRSLAYYQAEGGVYNEIITVLTKMRKEPKFRGLPIPAKALNEACFLYDLKQLRDLSIEEEKKYISEIDSDLSKVLGGSDGNGLGRGWFLYCLRKITDNRGQESLSAQV